MNVAIDTKTDCFIDEATCLRIYRDVHPDSRNDLQDVGKLLVAWYESRPDQHEQSILSFLPEEPTKAGPDVSWNRHGRVNMAATVLEVLTRPGLLSF
jgi:hypothetical protein